MIIERRRFFALAAATTAELMNAVACGFPRLNQTPKDELQEVVRDTTDALAGEVRRIPLQEAMTRTVAKLEDLKYHSLTLPGPEVPHGAPVVYVAYNMAVSGFVEPFSYLTWWAAIGNMQSLEDRNQLVRESILFWREADERIRNNPQDPKLTQLPSFHSFHREWARQTLLAERELNRIRPSSSFAGYESVLEGIYKGTFATPGLRSTLEASHSLALLKIRERAPNIPLFPINTVVSATWVPDLATRLHLQFYNLG